MHPLPLILFALLPVPEPGEVPFTPTAAEADVPAAFRMPESTFAFERQELRTTPGFTVSAIRFPSPVVTADVDNNTVHAEYFRPTRPGKRPAVIVLHIL